MSFIANKAFFHYSASMLEDGRIRMELTHTFVVIVVVPHPWKKMKTLNMRGKDSRRPREEVVSGFIKLWKVEVCNSITFVLGTKAYFHRHARMLGWWNPNGSVESHFCWLVCWCWWPSSIKEANPKHFQWGGGGYTVMPSAKGYIYIFKWGNIAQVCILQNGVQGLSNDNSYRKGHSLSGGRSRYLPYHLCSRVKPLAVVFTWHKGPHEAKPSIVGQISVKSTVEGFKWA